MKSRWTIASSSGTIGLASSVAKTLSPIHPNAGIAALYHRRLLRLVEQMQISLGHWIAAQWRREPPRLAQDEAPTDMLRELARLRRYWQAKFDQFAPGAAQHFTEVAGRQADDALLRALREYGFSVRFVLTRNMREALNSIVGENVSLIRSIASEHLADIEQEVMRSISQGRRLDELTKVLEHRYDLTRNRAALIALDQNNKATAALTRVRQLEAGIRRARWLHSGGGKHPRESHVAFSQGRNGGPFFDVEKGAYIDGEWIWPGQKICCRCVSRPVLENL